ncbi:unnamed protein product [Durusdinium trenchii]|uniref:Uncharacterized protein n=1 Tax=Durusdinium trenchii TaxID=1381693 RepID=A0ABP0SK64_9DINO
MPQLGQTRVAAVAAPMSPMSDGARLADEAPAEEATIVVSQRNAEPGQTADAVDPIHSIQDRSMPWAQPRISLESSGPRRPSFHSRVNVAIRTWLGLPVPASQELDLRRLQAEEFGISFGVPTGDAAIIKAVKRVIILSVISCTYYICAFIARLLLGQYSDPGNPNSPDELWSGCSQLIIELSIPACGYYGALYTHRTLLFFFCGANLIFVVASGINFLRFVIRMSGGEEACALEAYNSSQQRDCELLHSNAPLRFLFLSSLLALTWFSCLSFGAGKGLYQGLAPVENHPFSSVPVVGEVIATPEVETPSGATNGLRNPDRQAQQMAALLAADAARRAQRSPPRTPSSRGSRSTSSRGP